LSALATWIDSLRYDGHSTKILGGSLAQSSQIYHALREFERRQPGRSPLTAFTKRTATFCTGSEVSILAASPTSVRGPHVATLRLDEVDEIDAEIRDAAVGMCLGVRGVPASISMTSTWHRLGGPMSELIERGRAGEFPVHTLCVFDVLEPCPPERSGENLERCGACPLMIWCHEDRDRDPMGRPKAKRSRGHYPIDSLIQKVKAVSRRVFESDYLCLGPRADGVWFGSFDDRNIVDAEYDPTLPVHVSVDSGVFTAAVMFQMRADDLWVIGEYLSEGQSAEAAAVGILDELERRAGSCLRRVSTDASGGARNPVGPTVIAEYRRAGLSGEKGIETWPKYPGSVTARLGLLEALVRSADDQVHLRVHPRCVRLIAAFKSYARARRGGQWQDYPEDPQHPHEDLIDALSGGVHLLFPEGRRPAPKLRYRRAARVF
jgi:hypothetical protein